MKKVLEEVNVEFLPSLFFQTGYGKVQFLLSILTYHTRNVSNLKSFTFTSFKLSSTKTVITWLNNDERTLVNRPYNFETSRVKKGY